MTRSLAPLLLAVAACAHGPSSPSTGGRTGASSSPSEVRAGGRPSDGSTAKAEERRAEPPPKPLPRAAVLEEITGLVRAVDRKAHTVTVEAGGAEVTLTLDRNTMVYTPAGLGTVLDLVPGAQVRAGRNADLVAYWVQVRGPARADPSSTPGQGTGPGGGAGAPPERGTGPGGGGEAAPGTSLPGPTGAGPGTRP